MPLTFRNAPGSPSVVIRVLDASQRHQIPGEVVSQTLMVPYTRLLHGPTKVAGYINYPVTGLEVNDDVAALVYLTASRPFNRNKELRK